MRIFPKVIYGAAITGLILGCSMQPRQDHPSLGIEVPETWASSSPATGSVSQAWLVDFQDPILVEMVGEAMGGNLDLRAAAARVDAARARARIEAADLYPQLSGGLSASRSKRNSSGNFAIVSSVSNNFATTLDVEWEADIWRKLRDQSRAALLDAKATEQDFTAARLSLAANIAQAWFNAIEAKLQVTLANRTVTSFRNNLQVAEEGFRSGLKGALEVRLERANVAGAQSRLQERKVALDQAVRTLEILLGRYPGFALALTDELPDIIREIPAGLPSDLLARRPDVRAAELRFAAAGRRVGVARKNMLPSIKLTAAGGTSTDEFKNLLDSDFLVWRLISNLTAPIFQGGRLRAQADLAVANQKEDLADYAKVTLQAFQEVESALTAERLLTEQQAALQTAATESIEAEQLALDQYRAGLVDIITLLEAQRRSFDAQSRLLEVSNQRLQNRISLYLALGGSFAEQPVDPAERQTMATPLESVCAAQDPSPACNP